MHKIILVLFMITLSVSSVFSQSLERVREEANTDYVYTPDNSEYAKLWQQQVNARKSGDQVTHDRIAREISQKFPDRYMSGTTGSDVFRIINHQQPPFTPDEWGGDITVYPGVVGGTSPGNPTPFNRNIRLEADSLGNQYAAFLAGNRDTIVVFKSTNLGANWTRLFSILGSSSGNIHSFDMHITDSLNMFRLGFAISIISDAGTGFDGSMYWLSVDQTGVAVSVTPMNATGSGRGYIAPALVSDGFSWSAATTYWYMTFQNVDATTGVGDVALLSWSTNWGRTWQLDSARNSFNDYELDIDYSFAADSIYVLLTNNLTLTDENLRLRYSALANLGTGVTFKQVNTGSTTGHDRLGTLASNRQTNELAVLYTKFTGANSDIRICYSPDGTGPASRWTLDVPVSALPGNETNSTIKCQERQGAYRISYVSAGSGFDSVIYSSSFTPTGFTTRQWVNTNNTTATAPAVIGYRDGSGFGGGVLYLGTNALYYDGSPLVVGIDPIGNNIPNTFSLEQNFPNPFNPSTTIKFSIPKNGLVSLKVYDVMGREVASLVNGNMNAGSYNANFDASQLGSGIYFYKLAGDGFTDTKKMILVK